MASSDEQDEKLNDAEGGDEALSAENESETALAETEGEAIEGESEGDDDEIAAQTIGSERYVHAAFFVAGILAAFIASKTLVLVWNSLANWPAAVRAVPQLVSYGEEQRDTAALLVGAVIGALVVIQSYRKENVRTWANEVAAELTKVTWPKREDVPGSVTEGHRSPGRLRPGWRRSS